MAEWIQPLELQTWFINVFSGNPNIFTAIAIIALGGIAGYFRMNMSIFAVVLLLFFGMFQQYIVTPFFILMAIIGGLVLGIIMSKVGTR